MGLPGTAAFTGPPSPQTTSPETLREFPRLPRPRQLLLPNAPAAPRGASGARRRGVGQSLSLPSLAGPPPRAQEGHWGTETWGPPSAFCPVGPSRESLKTLQLGFFTEEMHEHESWCRKLGREGGSRGRQPGAGGCGGLTPHSSQPGLGLSKSDEVAGPLLSLYSVTDMGRHAAPLNEQRSSGPALGTRTASPRLLPLLPGDLPVQGS